MEQGVTHKCLSFHMALGEGSLFSLSVGTRDARTGAGECHLVEGGRLE